MGSQNQKAGYCFSKLENLPNVAELHCRSFSKPTPGEGKRFLMGLVQTIQDSLLGAETGLASQQLCGVRHMKEGQWWG